MSLSTIIVTCMAVLFFGGIFCLNYVSRKNSERESKPEGPVRLVPREQPVELSKEPAAAPSGPPITFNSKSSRKKKKHLRNAPNQRHVPKRAAS